MQDLARQLKHEAASIAEQAIQDWNRLAEKEPWHRLPPSLDLDHLPELIRCLADAALGTFFARDERVKLAEYAVKHGEHRFTSGSAEDILQREYELLRWGMWNRIKKMTTSERASEAIIRLDSAMTFALGATLRGYHRQVIEETGDWPNALARYIDEWSFPAH